MTETTQLTAIDHHFAGFINRLDCTPSDELWLAAALTSAAAGRGHICLDLAKAAESAVIPFKAAQNPLRTPTAQHWQDTLFSCNTVGGPGDYTPLVLDEAARLYLNRSWQYERSVADTVLSRLGALPVNHELLLAGLDRTFPSQTRNVDWQRIAATAAVSRRFTVITGGPGAGKTTTVARILALLIEQAGEQALTIALAAPTGKAAMRLHQSILRAIKQMGLPDIIRSHMPDTVQTIHRLLGVIPNATSFRHNLDNPLVCDILVVDEVSMVDLPLMAHLLEALKDDARLILLGDQDQLASVEAGAVLADICNHGAQIPFSPEFRCLLEEFCGTIPVENISTEEIQCQSPMSDSIIHLRTSYRFGADSGIGSLSRLINNGDSSAALELLQSNAHTDLIWRPLPTGSEFDTAFAATVRDAYGAYAQATTPGKALDELERFRVLSPHRNGIHGVENLNRLTAMALGLGRAELQTWCRLLPIMVTGNNYELGLFNGDTAVLMDNTSDGRLTAFFPNPEGGLRSLSPFRLPPYEIAFALTVHKSQGSEFEQLLLILPERISEAISRELLYTAVTRARTRLEIWGTEEVFCRAVEQRIVRNSGLRDRLWGKIGSSFDSQRLSGSGQSTQN